MLACLASHRIISKIKNLARQVFGNCWLNENITSKRNLFCEHSAYSNLMRTETVNSKNYRKKSKHKSVSGSRKNELFNIFRREWTACAWSKMFGASQQKIMMARQQFASEFVSLTVRERKKKFQKKMSN